MMLNANSIGKRTLFRRFAIKHYWKLTIFNVIVNAFLIAFRDTNIIKLGRCEILSFII